LNDWNCWNGWNHLRSSTLNIELGTILSNLEPRTLNASKGRNDWNNWNYHKSVSQPPGAKTAKPETFIDNSILAEIGKSGFVDRLHGNFGMNSPLASLIASRQDRPNAHSCHWETPIQRH
jgi:hypothetical protein